MATRFLLQQDRHPDTKHNIEGPVRDKEIVTGLLGNVHEEARGKSGEFKWCNSSEVKLQILLLPLFRTSFYRHSYRSLSRPSRYETSLWTLNPTSDYAFIVDKPRYLNLNFSFEVCLRSLRDLITARFVLRCRLLLQFNTWNILSFR